MTLAARAPKARVSEFARILADLLHECYDRPVEFNEYVLGRPPYWPKQIDVCNAVKAHKTVICPWGNEIGKSFLAAGLILWWLYTRPGSLVVTTAPSQTLLATVLFKELRRAISVSPLPLPGRITEAMSASPQTLVVDPAGWQVLGIATRGVERLSGQHNPNLLIVVDEASGVEAEIWEALRSQDPEKVVVFGNPLRAEGEFAELHRRAARERDDPSIPEAERVVEVHCASTESPDIHLDRSPRGLASAGFLREIERTYGRGSLYWTTHVDAIFPEVSADQLLSLVWLDRCAGWHRGPLDPFAPVVGTRRISCDLGEGVGRDRTVVLVRDDLGILEVIAGDHLGEAEAAEAIARMARKWQVPHERITYDALGIGRKLHNHLYRHGITAAVAFKGSGKPDNPNAFVNARTEAAWKLHLRLDPDWSDDARVRPGRQQVPFHIPAAPWWPSMREELAALTYDFAGKKTRLLPKEDWMHRLGRSPDLGDALIQAFSVL
jgi:hypothetical protein